jgi:type VI secretion system secreted protein Hcp
MAVDMFLKLDGVKGESLDKAYAGEIDVLAWSWGVSQSGSSHVGGGSGAGKANVQDLSLTKWVDQSTPDLILACCNGSPFKKATLVVRKAGEKPLEYLKIHLEDLIISSVSTGGSGGEDRLTENVSLNFAKVKVEYVQQTREGGPGKQFNMGWDIAANEKL